MPNRYAVLGSPENPVGGYGPTDQPMGTLNPNKPYPGTMPAPGPAPWTGPPLPEGADMNPTYRPFFNGTTWVMGGSAQAGRPTTDADFPSWWGTSGPGWSSEPQSPQAPLEQMPIASPDPVGGMPPDQSFPSEPGRPMPGPDGGATGPYAPDPWNGGSPDPIDQMRPNDPRMPPMGGFGSKGFSPDPVGGYGPWDGASGSPWNKPAGETSGMWDGSGFGAARRSGSNRYNDYLTGQTRGLQDYLGGRR
jgi:hypothetical protein